MSTKPDGSAKVDAYLRDKDPGLQELAQKLRALVSKCVPGVQETLNPWGIPTFELQGPVCYFMIGKNHVTFGFDRGMSLDDPGGLLEGTGKNMRHLKLRKPADLRQAGLRELIENAARLNRESPPANPRMSARRSAPPERK